MTYYNEEAYLGQTLDNVGHKVGDAIKHPFGLGDNQYKKATRDSLRQLHTHLKNNGFKHQVNKETGEHVYTKMSKGNLHQINVNRKDNTAHYEVKHPHSTAFNIMNHLHSKGLTNKPTIDYKKQSAKYGEKVGNKTTQPVGKPFTPVGKVKTIKPNKPISGVKNNVTPIKQHKPEMNNKNLLAHPLKPPMAKKVHPLNPFKKSAPKPFNAYAALEALVGE